MKYEPADWSRPHLAYTIDDDGIHYTCPCGFDRNLGFWPTVEEALHARYTHDSTGCDLRERGWIGE